MLLRQLGGAIVSKHLSEAQMFTETIRDSYRPTTTTAIEIGRFFLKK
jgi:hypothetical protein